MDLTRCYKTKIFFTFMCNYAVSLYIDEFM